MKRRRMHVLAGVVPGDGFDVIEGTRLRREALTLVMSNVSSSELADMKQCLPNHYDASALPNSKRRQPHRSHSVLR